MRSLPLFATVALSAFAVCQNSRTSPQLTLKVMIEKDTFRVAEKLNASFELKNVSSRTLCFPPPIQQCERPVTGFLILESSKVDSIDQDMYYCHTRGAGTPSDELEAEIRNHWIRLQPNAVYRVTAEESQYHVLTSAGPWRLEARYEPPQKSTRLERATAEKTGCTLPDTSAVAEPILITVKK